MTATSPVLKQIAGLPKLSHAELKALWREYFGVEPPAYRRGFLIRGLAHRIQELTYGGLKPTYQARLDAMIEEQRSRTARPARTTAAPGCPPARGHEAAARVAGREHEVTVIDGGYEHEGSATGASGRSPARSPAPGGPGPSSSASARPGAGA